ncbi:MAG TPA: DNA repair exonuclease [archaeon]|nr:DNA repair exonuclease [archaeon]
MKLAIFSDTHLGFSWETERREDSFLQCREAFQLAASEGADCVLLCGDVFDERTPRPEVMERAMALFSDVKNLEWKKDCAKVVSKGGRNARFTENGKPPFRFPIIAIHGTHEYRTKEFKNPLEVVEAAGFIVHVHGENALLEKDGEKLSIFGVGGMPDAYVTAALSSLKERGKLKPEPGACNVFALHQTFKDFIPAYDDENGFVSLSDLPEGFDLYVNGHFHWAQEIPFRGTTFLMPGSTVRTQMKKLESEIPKRVYFLETKSKRVYSRDLSTPRPFFYKELNPSGAEPRQVVKETREFIAQCVAQKLHRKPLIRVRIRGSLAKGFKAQDVELGGVEGEFKEKAILSLSKELASESLREKILNLRELHKSKPSVEELGMQLLMEELKAAGFDEKRDLPGNLDVESLFKLLSESDSEEAWRLLHEKILEKKMQ